MSKHKKQHYVPRSYLEAWTDPRTPEGYQPYVWIFSKDTHEGKRKSPSNIFHETDLYTMKIGENRDLTIEKGLSQLEGKFSILNRDKLEKSSEITDFEHIILCAFTAAMYSRTLAFGNLWKPIFGDLANKMEMLGKQIENATPERTRAVRSSFGLDKDKQNIVTIEEIEVLAEKPTPSLVSTHLEEFTPLLYKLDMMVIKTSIKPGFITSDNPCVWIYSSETDKPITKGIYSPNTEIHLPISPQQCVLFNQRGQNGYLDLSQFDTEAEKAVVNETNDRTYKNSKNYVVVNENMGFETWF